METYQEPTGLLVTAEREREIAEAYHERAMQLRAAGYVQSAILNLMRAAEHRAAARKLEPAPGWRITAAGRAALYCGPACAAAAYVERPTLIRPCDRCGLELGRLPAGAPGRGYDRCADCHDPEPIACERRGCDAPLDDKSNCPCCDYAPGDCPHA